MSTFITIELKGGLCNKIYKLIAACEIAIQEQSCIIDPTFGWKEDVLFSELFDLTHFNQMIEKTFHINPLIVKNNQQTITKSIDAKYLWEHHKSLRNSLSNNVPLTDICLVVINALKLNKTYTSIISKINKPYTCIHIRTEQDWQSYCEKKDEIPTNEQIFVNIPELIKMYKKSECQHKTIFFTSGENHKHINQLLNINQITPTYYFNPKYEYEVNAAINFFICCNSTYFIGNSRSSYSNCITIKRALMKKYRSYIYNYKHTITKRKDKGMKITGENTQDIVQFQ